VPIVLVLVGVGVVFAQSGQKPFEPAVGQAGKDVIWVPTPPGTVEKMLELTKVTEKDFVIDLGSGDGRTVITAAKRGARALGIEYNPDMVALSKANAAKEGVADRATFVKADLFESDFSQATVITMFLLPDINVRLRPRLLDLKPGVRIVSNSFEMGEWKADDSATVTEGCTTWCTPLLWIVPAKVEGVWQLPNGELTLKQEFQAVSGTLGTGGKTVPIEGGQLRGNDISFFAGDTRYTGRVNGNTIEGTAGPDKWRAVAVIK
jgi:hypothetical protein